MELGAIRSFFILILISNTSFSFDREDIRKVIKKKNDTYIMKNDGKVRRVLTPNYVDINRDGTNEVIKIIFENGHYLFNIYNLSERLIFSQKIRISNTGSGIDRYFIQNIGDKIMTIVIFIREGTYKAEETYLTRRIDLLTFHADDLSEIYYKQGPIITLLKKDWKDEKFELNSRVYFTDRGPYKRKSLIIKDENSSTTLKWSDKYKNWY